MRNIKISFIVSEGMVDAKMARQLNAWGLAVRSKDYVEDAVAHFEDKKVTTKKKVVKKKASIK